MLTDENMKIWAEVFRDFDLLPIRTQDAITQIITRMEKGGYNTSTESSMKVFGKTLYSVKFFKGDEIIHATGQDLLSCYREALAAAHRSYRENLPPQARDVDLHGSGV
jgi:hypothetical protein